MKEFMEEAINLANINLKTKDGGPFGACIVKDGKIIGKGRNKVLLNHDSTAHAEISAIRDAENNLNSHDLSGCVIYTSCFPCPMCLGAIIWANIKEIYYANTRFDADSIGFRDDDIYEFINDYHDGNPNNSIKLHQMLRDEAIKSFEEYNKNKNKAVY